MRYWDGNVWTPHVQPLPPAADAQPVTPRWPTLNDRLSGYWAQATRYAATDAGKGTGTAVAGGALLADGVIGLGRRQGIAGAVGGMLFGAAFVAVSLLGLKPLILDPATTHAGEATTQGTVVDQHAYLADEGRMCSPEASFVVAGTTYTAATSGASSTCPALGSHVTVIYRTADPADARVAPERWLQVLGWAFPVVGVLILVSSLWTFVVRAGEISVGGVLLFRGLRARRTTRGV
jgi:hypothetical protein